MTDSTKKNKTSKEKLRFVILNDETFAEKFSVSMSKNNMFLWITGSILLITILIFLFIAFTPVKRIMPGYASIENNIYVIRMNSYVNDLEKQIDLQEKYNNTLRKLLVGGGDSIILSQNEINNMIQNPKNGENEITEIYSFDKEGISIPHKRNNSIGNYYFIPPLIGKVNNKVDFKHGHYGVDIAGAKNVPIKTIMDGIVIIADYTIETGYTIAIQHPNDMVSVYKHNDKLLKKIGNFVGNGEAIAIIGNTGTLTDGPHLHFELWYKSTPLNPEDFILFE